MNRTFIAITAFMESLCALTGAIVKPADAPKPKPPIESAQSVQLPDGFRLDLIAAEPLIRQPSGLCFAADGSLFVTEAHGYNMEGQYDIEELNKTGELDRIVRRIPAPDDAIRRAQKDQIGTVKRLTDTNGDGLMDRAETWADGLPICMGLSPARGGVIVVCAPDILFLADPDGDGHAEVRERLFTGFNPSIVERRINSPIWGPDNWIYVDGGRGGTITGPNLTAPVELPITGFRFKPDGSAIEPVSGHSGTYGFTFNSDGDRFVVSTGSPGIQIAPLPWQYLARNKDLALAAPNRNAADSNRTFPISEPHPWRTQRAADPGFENFYRGRYGAAESTPDGYFTSACSPLVYQDSALPGLNGQLLTCEPAQNMVHRAHITRQGIRLNLRRVSREEKTEFLASSDVWFHPVHLHIGPAGGIWIADFYREIIEDYSAIPRYLQQLYGLKDGENHGRLWRLVHREMPQGPPIALDKLDETALAHEVGSPRYWRRQTARRLLLEQTTQVSSSTLKILSQLTLNPETAIANNALYTLEGLGHLTDEILILTLEHPQPGVQRHALRLADHRFDANPRLLEVAISLATTPSAMVRLQLALSLGQSSSPGLLPVLGDLAKTHGNEPWMNLALLSSLSNRAGSMLSLLLDASNEVNQAHAIIPQLYRAIGNQYNAIELSKSIALITQLPHPSLQTESLRQLRAAYPTPTKATLTAPGRGALKELANSEIIQLRTAALKLTRTLSAESSAERSARISKTLREIGNLELSVERRLRAVKSLAEENDSTLVAPLLNAYPSATPKIRSAILKASFSRSANLPKIVTALEQKIFPTFALSAVQRLALTDQEGELGTRAAALFSELPAPNKALFKKFADALNAQPDTIKGGAVFRLHCATCHEAHGIGYSVGPNLTSESRRAEETLINDVLAPSATIEPGHETYVLETNDGRILSGILANESANSLTLSLPGGVRLDTLRRDIKSMKTLPVSLMPESLATTVSPTDLANLIAWLRQPPAHRSLFDEHQNFAALLKDGSGTATIDASEHFTGNVSLRITPPQRFAQTIPGWRFPIRENPGPGEFRYLKLAWKAPGAKGIMLELAGNGGWPSSDDPRLRYYTGANTMGWQATQISEEVPEEWKLEIVDLWKDFGHFTLTGMAPTAMGGTAWFDSIELLRSPPN